RQQSYIGPDNNTDTQATIARLRSPELQESRNHRRSMAKMLRQAGYTRMDATMEGAMLALSRTGLFRSGVTLIGTPAYQAILHQMGVSERVAIQTNDVDLSVDRLKLGIPENINIEKVLRAWNDKISPVPAMNLKYGEASMKIRGKDFHIDFLTAGSYAFTGRPVHVSAIQFHAEILPFLDYLLEEPQKALLMTRYGMIAQVPEAGRFMWHKCVTSACRPSVWEAKRKKDLIQARTLFNILKERDPDAIRDAYIAIKDIQEPKVFMKKLQSALRLPEMVEMQQWVSMHTTSSHDQEDALPNEAYEQEQQENRQQPKTITSESPTNE
ncbi:GSU2403 family nucleotidyltransferase fold protein, partial [Acidithiobacillus sulfurivorans]